MLSSLFWIAWSPEGLLAQDLRPSPWGTKTVTLDQISFTVPEFCSIEKVSTDQLCKWPIAATFAPDGSLIVAESVWNMKSKETVQQQLISRPHRIVRLRDTDGDGKYDERQVVADQLSFPEGVLCIGRDIYVTAPPEIWKLTDSDGDGVCEKREVWFDGTTLTGCANDLHGPWLGPDGWIYWAKAAFAEQSHEILSGKDWKSKASHLYRRNPNGGPIDPVMTGGMDNLVDVAWLPNGDRFFCATFLHHPRHGFRDGIGAASYGALFGKPHAVLDGHPRTGSLMEPTCELGPAAPAGLMYLGSLAPQLKLPELKSQNADSPAMQLEGYLLCAQFNLHQISLSRLLKRQDQAHYRSESFSVVSSDRIDFHPVDLLLDSDASILIVDTGGWYDLCCPSSGTDQRVATGGVYRLKGLTLESRSPAESRRLGSSVTQTGSEVLEEMDRLAKSLRYEGIGNSSWIKLQCLTEVSDLYARTKSLIEGEFQEQINKLYDRCVIEAIGDSDPEVAMFACHLAALYRMEGSRDAVALLLTSKNASLRRSAAEVLGRIGIRSEVFEILNQINASYDDRSLVHSLVFALIEGADDSELLNALNLAIENKQLFPSTAALVRILNHRGKLVQSHADVVLQLALSEQGEWAGLGVEVLEAHPQWSDAILGSIASRLDGSKSPPSEPLIGLLARWSGNSPVAQWVATELLSSDSSRSEKDTALQLLAKLAERPVPGLWNEAIARLLGESPIESSGDWQDALQNRKWTGDASAIQNAITAKLLKVQASDQSDTDKRQNLLAWVAMMPKGASVDEPIEVGVLQSAMGPAIENNPQAKALRQLAWQSLAGLQLRSAPSRQYILEQLQNAGALELPVAIETYLKGSSAEQDAQLLEVLSRLPASKTLSVDGLLGKLKDRPAEVQKKWRESIEAWTRPDQDVAEKIDQWLAKLKQGDPKQGYHVFRSTKATCSACHQVGYVGGNVGPVLSKIGQSRTRRDLVEAVLFPSARLEQAYRSTKVRLQDGEIVQGLVVSESPRELVLQISAQQRRSIDPADIELREASSISIMPSGLESQLTIDEFSDLIAFLESAK